MPSLTNEDSDDTKIISTDGGDHIGAGGLKVGGHYITGDYVARDKIEHQEVHFYQSPEEELDRFISQAVSTFETKMLDFLRPDRPSKPYKNVAPFSLSDQEIFCGRNKAIEELYNTVFGGFQPLTVLHAPSGAGKSSLLNAGLGPLLLRNRYLPIFARTYENPILAIVNQITDCGKPPLPDLLPKLSLHEFLVIVTEKMRDPELVVILDQFEEIFTLVSPEIRMQQFAALANCIDNHNRKLRFIFAIRGDFFSNLDEFKDRMPSILNNRFFLKQMGLEEIKEAITEPVNKVNRNLPKDRRIEYDDALLDILLKDLVRNTDAIEQVVSNVRGNRSKGDVNLPELQIICTTLYERASQKITRELYDKVGGAQGILGHYLEETIKNFPVEQHETAKQVLINLVDGQGRRRLVSQEELMRKLGDNSQLLNQVLRRLVNERLLQRDEFKKYELAHDYLAAKVKNWVGPEELQARRAMELLQNEVDLWHERGSLIPPSRLQDIYKQKEILPELSQDMIICLIQSAVRANFDVEYWLNRSRQPVDELTKPIIEDLKSEEPIRRQHAAETLGVLARPGMAEALITTLARIDDELTKQSCIQALIRMGSVSVDPIIDYLRKVSDEVPLQHTLVAILGDLGDSRAVEPLIKLLVNTKSRVSQRTIVTGLGRLGDKQTIEPLLDLLKESINSDLQIDLASAFAQLGDARAIKPLVKTMRETEIFEVRAKIAEALKALQKSASEEKHSIQASIEHYTHKTLELKLEKAREEFLVPRDQIADIDTQIRQLKSDLQNATAQLNYITGTLNILESSSERIFLIKSLYEVDSEQLRLPLMALLSELAQPSQAIAFLVDNLTTGEHNGSRVDTLLAVKAMLNYRNKLLQIIQQKKIELCKLEIQQANLDTDISEEEKNEGLMLQELVQKTETRLSSLDQALKEVETQLVEILINILQSVQVNATQNIIIETLGCLGQVAVSPLVELMQKSQTRQTREIITSGLNHVTQTVGLIADLSRTEVEHLEYLLIVQSRALNQLSLQKSVASISNVPITLYSKIENTRKAIEQTKRRFASVKTALDDLKTTTLQPIVSLSQEIQDEYIKQILGSAMGWLGRINLSLGIKELGTPTIKTIISAFQDTESQWKIRALAETLGQLEEKRAVKLLIKTLQETDDTITKRCLVRILGRLRDQRAIPLLQVLLEKTNDYWIKLNIIQALGQIGTEQATYILETTLQRETDFWIRTDVARVLFRLNWKPGHDDTASIYWISKGDWNKLIELGTLAVDPLFSALKERNPWVRKNAIETLKKLDDFPDKKDELEIIANQDDYFRVRECATEILAYYHL